MTLSAPIFVLKGRAKSLARETGIPLHQALDQIARDEGVAAWSLLMSRHSRDADMSQDASSQDPDERLYQSLEPGDLLLLAARPRQGKTLLGLKLAILAMRSGHPGVFFSLEYNESDIDGRFVGLGEDRSAFRLFEFDDSDDISADYVIERLATAVPGTMVVIDYLQLLDQKRSNPPVMAQIKQLKAFAAARRLIMVFISQVDRAYDRSDRSRPGLDDVRLPNPLDLSLFDKTCFVACGELIFDSSAA